MWAERQKENKNGLVSCNKTKEGFSLSGITCVPSIDADWCIHVKLCENQPLVGLFKYRPEIR
jgi:hypothetical protein